MQRPAYSMCFWDKATRVDHCLKTSLFCWVRNWLKRGSDSWWVRTRRSKWSRTLKANLLRRRVASGVACVKIWGIIRCDLWQNPRIISSFFSLRIKQGVKRLKPTLWIALPSKRRAWYQTLIIAHQCNNFDGPHGFLIMQSSSSGAYLCAYLWVYSQQSGRVHGWN